MISIHAPLTGSDRQRSILRQKIACHFNPRSPYGERPSWKLCKTQKCKFQSTLPLRGATATQVGACTHMFISIHAPLTGSDQLPHWHQLLDLYFNPRSPYGERLANKQENTNKYRFQSTLPLRGATNIIFNDLKDITISIHAPLTGSDGSVPDLLGSLINFNPRSPYGERRYGAECALGRKEFQSTLPLRGATAIIFPILHFVAISIHAPLTGSDPPDRRPPEGEAYFNPRSPYGERH